MKKCTNTITGRCIILSIILGMIFSSLSFANNGYQTNLELNPLLADKNASGYTIVDTAQTTFFDDKEQISSPAPTEAYYGQDALFSLNKPSYTISKDNLSVYDHHTQLTWLKSSDTTRDGKITVDDKMTLDKAQTYCDTLNGTKYGGYSDWRVPGIKELYSLIVFSGRDPSGLPGNDTSGLIPFIDTRYFDFEYGDTASGERIIDAQYLSSTQYVSTTMHGNATLFGVNFADGRIKGYPLAKPNGFYVICVRGNSDYGKNIYSDNGDGTVSDSSTGLMWSQSDNGTAINWKDALAWAQSKNAENYLGYSDWRLPDAKELHSILDYTRSPATTLSPAMNPIFQCSSIINEAGVNDYPYFWSSTTHAAWNGKGAFGAYIAFGRALGYMNGSWIDVHGAGAQRSDPKSGDVDDYKYGLGPQGDAIRIYNYVRLVRTHNNVTNYYLPLFKSQPEYWSGLGITNLSQTSTANIIITIYNQSGTTLMAQTESIPARGQGAFNIGTALNSDGWVKITSDQPIIGLNFLGQYKNGTSQYFMADVPFTQTLSNSLMIPHVAQNETWDTMVYLANPNTSSASVTLTYFNKDATASTPYITTLSVNGSKEISVSTITGSTTIKGGYITVSSTQNLAAFAIYNNLKTGNYSFAGINAVDTSQ